MTVSRQIRRVGALLVASTIVGSVVVAGSNASAHIAQEEEGISLLPRAAETPKPSPKPTTRTKAQLKSWGATIKSKRQSSRLGKKGSKTNPTPKKASAKKATPSPRLRNLMQDRRVRRQPFRLNIGICGRMAPDGTVPGPTWCQPEWATPAVDPTAGPTTPVVQQSRPQDVSWEQVLSESQDVVFPGLHVKVQPAGRTLVNLDTIVYTEDSKVSNTTVTLLGFPVVVEATPMSYTWSFGDGATLTTTSPGKPYPAKEITHKYMKRGGVSVAVTTNYAARFNVAGTGWQYVDGTVPITGPATPLLVREAVPVLVDPAR